MRYRMEKWIAVLTAAVLCVACCMSAAFGYERIDLTKSADLSLCYTDGERGGRALSGMELQLYRVAEISDAAAFSVCSAFAGAQVDLNDDESNWPALAGTLEAYVRLHPETVRSSCLAEGKTDNAGCFEAKGLPLGLYLVMGNAVRIGSDTYTPTPFLLTLPYLDREQDAWRYSTDLPVQQKYTREHHSSGGGSVSVNVKKVWASDEGQQRPAAVQVALLKDGAPYDTVQLNGDNGWKYSWRDLDRNAAWTLTEDNIPAGYTVLVEKSGSTNNITFTVTNTGAPGNPLDNPPDNPPDDSGDDPSPTPGDDGEPGQTPDDTQTDEPSPETGEKLPQTGFLWWPVALLSAAGAALLLAGWQLREKRERRA